AMQYTAERALAEQVDKMGAKGGTAIVSDPRTGEILALATVTRSEPNGPIVTSANNTALTTVFEPGSAAKVITMSAALEEHRMEPTTGLAVPNHISIGGSEFTDHDPHATEQMTPTDIMAVSSNVGTIMLGQKLGANNVDSYMRKFGFGQPTSLGFPSESPGLMLPLKDWSKTSLATIPIGQGIAVTAMQMLESY